MFGNPARAVFEQLRQYSRARRIRARLPDAQWRSAWERAQVDLDRVRVTESGSLRVELATGALELPKTGAGLEIASGAALLEQLVSRARCAVSWDEAADELVLRHEGNIYRVGGFEELYIAGEILLEGAYHLLCAGATVLVDVGANVGFASIHLAGRNPALVVEAFEPVEATCERAQQNFDANPALRDRIRLHRFGLFSESGERGIQSARSRRGMSSLVINRSAAHDDIEVLQIRLQRASEALTALLARHVGRRVVVKMDCEGSEYAILGDLMASGLLARIDVLMLEWHKVSAGGDEVERLFDDLREHGFHVYIPGPFGPAHGAGTAVCCNSHRGRP